MCRIMIGLNVTNTKQSLMKMALISSISVIMFIPIEISAAELDVYTRVDAQEEYSSNIYLTKKDHVSDLTACLTPSLNLKWYTPKSKLSLKYNLNVVEYDFKEDARFRSQEKDYLLWHQFKLEVGTHTRAFLGKRLHLNFVEEFFQNDDPHRLERGYLIGRTEYYVNRYSPQIRYLFGDKVQLLIKYTRENLNYDHQDFEDSVEDRGTASVRYLLNSKNRLSAEYHYAERDFDASQDYKFNHGWFKLHHIANSYIEGEVGAGYQIRDYSDGIVSDWSGCTALARLDVHTQNKFKSRLTYQFNPNTIGTYVFYTIHRLDLNLEFKPIPSLTLVIDPFIQWDTYKRPEKLRDHIGGAGGRIGYRFNEDWKIECGYHFLKRSANVITYNYQDHNFFVSVSMGYEIL